MKSITHLAVALGLLLLPQFLFSQTKIENGVVIVKAFDEDGNEVDMGAGMIVSKRGIQLFILTAYHVIENGATFSIQTYGLSENVYQAKLFEPFNEELDMAVLIAEVSIMDIDPYKFKRSKKKKLTPNTKLAAIGHPYGEEWTYNDLNFAKRSDAPHEIKMTQEFIYKGYSGGPMLTKKRNRLLGMVTNIQGQTTLGLRESEIVWYLEQWRIPHNLIGRTVKKSTYYLVSASAALAGNAFYWHDEAVKDFELLEDFRDEEALEDRHQKTHQQLESETKTDLLIRDLSTGLSIVCLATGMLIEFDVIKFGQSKGPASIHVDVAPQGIQLGLNVKF